MKNTIVAAIDFSAASLNAAGYAADFAVATQSDLALIHVCYFPVTGDVPMQAVFFNQSLEDAKKSLQTLQQHLTHKTGNKIAIRIEAVEGNVCAGIDQFCSTLHQPVVIMGAHVTNATERLIFGSTTLSAMRQLSWPLIIVPTGIRFTGIAIAGLACDLQDVATTIHAEQLIKFFSEFHPQLRVLHVSSKKHGLLSEDEIRAAQWLESELKTFHPSFHYMQDENIEEAVKTFSEENNLSLLIIIPKKHGLFNRLLHKSRSKQMILNSHIPVMSIHE